MNEVNIFGVTISSWIFVPAVFLIWVTLLWAAKKIVFRTIKRLTEKTKSRADDMFLQAADFPLTLLIVTSGGAVVERILPKESPEDFTTYFLVAFKAVTIIAIVLFIDKFLNSLIEGYSGKVEILRSTGGIARGVVRIIVISLGILVLLDSFGVSITPILASLGIGSLAVALALQPTLENFFAGVQLIIDKPVQIGHFVKLETGEEGYIHRIGWRSTWVRLLENNVIVIPNKSLINAQVKNFYYPETEMAVLVEIGVHYQSNLDHVERVTIEVAKETLKAVSGGVVTFEPFIRYHTLGSYSINFTVILRVKEFVDNYLIKHEFIKRLINRYATEGIVIPYPIEAVNLDQEQLFVNEALRKN